MNRIQSISSILLCVGITLGGAAQMASAFNPQPEPPGVVFRFGGEIQTDQGFVHPLLLVGFNPQPEPPGQEIRVTLPDPTTPTFNWSNEDHLYQIVFGFNLEDRGIVIINQDAMPDADGRFMFSLEGVGDGVFDVFLDFQVNDGAMDRASWVGFNPQPEPPGFEGMAVGFEFDVNPNSPSRLTMALRIQDRATGNFAIIPEPAGLALLGVGGLLLRRRARAE